MMKNFDIQWTALIEKKGDDSPETPKISKALPVIKWMEAIQDFLYRKIGNRNILWAYVTHDVLNPPDTTPPLAPGQPHSLEHRSVEAELIARASRAHVTNRPVLYLTCHVFLVVNESLLTQGNKDNKLSGLDSQFGWEKQSRPFHVIWSIIV